MKKNIDCNSVQNHLSAWIDRELEADLNAAITEHLHECQACAQTHADFVALESLVRQQDTGSRSVPDWSTIEPRMNAQIPANGTVAMPGADSSIDKSGSGPRLSKPAFGWVVAACLLLTLGATYVVWSINLAGTPKPIAQTAPNPLNLQSVIERMQLDPERSLTVLQDQYELKEISMQEASKSLGRNSFVGMAASREQLPGAAQPAATRLLSLPSCQCPPGQCHCGEFGCNCVVSICRRPDGSTYLVFEQCTSQQVSFGDLPVRTMTRGEQRFREIRWQNIVSVAIEREPGQVVVVGLRDDQELASFLAASELGR